MLTRGEFLVRSGAFVWHMTAGSQISLTVDESSTGLNLTGVVHLRVDVRPTPQKGVQFYADGAPLGSPVLNAPYVQALDTSNWAPGSTHILKAVAMFRSRNYTATLVVSGASSGGSAAWPSSFTSGPLGANNILPVSTSGALLGMHSIVQGNTEAQQEALTQARITDCGRNLDVIHQFGTPDNNNWKGITGWEDWAHGLGAVPMITLQGMSPTATLAAVNAGSCDAQFAAIANFLKTKQFRIMLRLFHEFNGNWFPWSVPGGSQNGNVTSTGAQFISAWRRVIGIFQSNGASNCGFAWSPAEGQDRATRDACYPGDAYVDWVSPDQYNSNSASFSTPTHSGWAEFYELFAYSPVSGFDSTYAHYAGSKPFIPGEVGSKYDTGTASRKADWFRNIATVAKPTYLPLMRGVIFFDADVQLFEAQTWRVDEKDDSSIDATTYQGFKDFSHNAAWNVGVAGGAT